MNAPTKNQLTDKKIANASQKLKEVQATAQIQRYCTTFNFAQAHPPPKQLKIFTETLLNTLATDMKLLSLPKVSRNKFQDYERNIWRIHSQTKSR